MASVFILWDSYIKDEMIGIFSTADKAYQWLIKDGRNPVIEGHVEEMPLDQEHD
jgi:hypothetical protein